MLQLCSLFSLCLRFSLYFYHDADQGTPAEMKTSLTLAKSVFLAHFLWLKTHRFAAFLSPWVEFQPRSSIFMGRSLSMFKTLLSVDYVCPRHFKSTKWVGIRKLWSKPHLFGTYRAKKASKKSCCSALPCCSYALCFLCV